MTTTHISESQLPSLIDEVTYKCLTSCINVGVACYNADSRKRFIRTVKKSSREMARTKNKLRDNLKLSMEFKNSMSRLLTDKADENAFRGYSLNILIVMDYPRLNKKQFGRFADSTYPCMSAVKDAEVFIVS